MTTQQEATPEATQEQAVDQSGGQAQPDGRRTPGRPRQNATVEEMNQLRDQLVAMSQNFSEFKANTSRREGVLERERDQARKAAEYGPDSDEYKSWEREDTMRQGRMQAEQETSAAKRDAAMWKIRAEYPQVPAEVYSAENDPVTMENQALRWLTTRGVVQQPIVQPAAEIHPETPMTMTQGGVGAPGQSDQDWINHYGDEVNGGIPGTPDNAKRASELIAKGLTPQTR